MNPGDVFGLIVVMIGIMGSIGILTTHLRRRMEHKERIAQIKAGETQAAIGSSPERDLQIEKLEHRIRVLERIATDKSNNLAAQIEDLREPAN